MGEPQHAPPRDLLELVAKYNKFEDLAQTNHQSSTMGMKESATSGRHTGSDLAFGRSSGYNPRRFTDARGHQPMIKVLRFANEKYPWFLAITMGFIAVTFIVGMGW